MTIYTVDKQKKSRFDTNPEGFIEKAIRKFVKTSSLNRLESFGGEPIFDQPLIGVADSDDPLFAEYKKVVHELHFSPKEILTLHLTETLKDKAPQVEDVSVISFVLPINRNTLSSNAQQKEGPSLRWNHTRWKGQDFITGLSTYLVSLLEAMGTHALAPEISPYFKIMQVSDGFTSNWSQRHIAYAAGLGTFSLNEGFITSKGLAMRCGSVVAGIKLKPSIKPYEHHLANCLFYASNKCGECIRRCPGGAISEKGHDKMKCFEVLFVKQKPWAEGVYGSGYIGSYAGCGLCQTGVHCERRIPVLKKRREKIN